MKENGYIHLIMVSLGRDEFSIVITNPDGTKNQYFFVVDVEDPLLGRTPDIDESGKDRGDVLPETGINNRGFSIIIGLLLICAGLKYFLRDIGTNGTN